MSAENKKSENISPSLNDEDVQHEIHYLRDRLNNLETFNRLFFELKQQNEKNIDDEDASSGDLVVTNPVIGFIHESSTVANYQDLAMLFFNALLEYNLDLCIQFHCGHDDLSYKQSEKCSDKEIELLSNIKNKRGVFESGNRLCVNFDSISLMVNDWSGKEPTKAKEIKKLVMLLCEATNNKIKSIQAVNISSVEIKRLQKNGYDA